MDDSDQKVLDQILDFELSARSGAELSGAYKAICSMVLVKTAVAVTKPSRPRKHEALQKRAAQEWVMGGRGLITFESACHAVGMDPDAAREHLSRHVSSGIGIAINKQRLNHGRPVFGRRPDVTNPDTETQARPGVVARRSAGDGSGGSEARPGEGAGRMRPDRMGRA